jgi:hypothetical protein
MLFTRTIQPHHHRAYAMLVICSSTNTLYMLGTIHFLGIFHHPVFINVNDTIHALEIVFFVCSDKDVEETVSWA